MPTIENWMVVAFRLPLTWAIAGTEPTGELQIAGIRYRQVSAGAVAAFYDRLVDPSLGLVGIRVYPVKELEHVLVSLPQLPNVVNYDGRYVDVFFGPSVVEGAVPQGDQAFGGRLYTGDDESFAISFDLGFLSDDPQEVRHIGDLVGPFARLT